MFRIELMKDSAKGANSVIFNGLVSKNLIDLFNFVNDNASEIFSGSDESIDQYYYEALEEYEKDNKNDCDIDEIKRINKYYYVAFDLLGGYDDYTAEQLFKTIDEHLNDLLNKNDKLCKYILEKLNIYNIGINFQKVSEE